LSCARFFGLGGSGVSSCKPAFAIAAILIWLFFAAVLWFNYLRKPPKECSAWPA
jgi:hypothetical protein